jgi:hypothetical protein
VGILVIKGRFEIAHQKHTRFNRVIRELERRRRPLSETSNVQRSTSNFERILGLRLCLPRGGRLANELRNLKSPSKPSGVAQEFIERPSADSSVGELDVSLFLPAWDLLGIWGLGFGISQLDVEFELRRWPKRRI